MRWSPKRCEARPERQALELRIGGTDERMRAAEAGRLPTIALVAAASTTRKPNPRIFPRQDKWNDSWDVGVNVSWSLWDGGPHDAPKWRRRPPRRPPRASALAEFDSRHRASKSASGCWTSTPAAPSSRRPAMRCARGRSAARRGRTLHRRRRDEHRGARRAGGAAAGRARSHARPRPACAWPRRAWIARWAAVTPYRLDRRDRRPAPDAPVRRLHGRRRRVVRRRRGEIFGFLGATAPASRRPSACCAACCGRRRARPSSAASTSVDRSRSASSGASATCRSGSRSTSS